MKGLEVIPTLDLLGDAYSLLQSGGKRIKPAQLALWSQWARFDPRLAEQWISHILARWQAIHPFEFNRLLLQQPWPAAGALLLEQAKLIADFDKADCVRFAHWAMGVCLGVSPSNGEQFFIGLRAFAGDEMKKDAELAWLPYQQWGFLGRELLANKAGRWKGRFTLLPPRTRKKLLDQVIAAHARFTVNDYIEATGGAVSRRQAELDLARHPRLRRVGRTNGSMYVRKAGNRT